MLRLIALVLFIVVAAFAYEAFSGNEIGVGRFLSSAASGVTAAFAGGYGIAHGVGTGIASALGR